MLWFTAIGSTDNIDQSQLISNASQWLWQTTTQKIANPFTPTKEKVTWVILQKNTSVWTFTWDVTISITNDTAWSPWTTTYASITIMRFYI